MLLCFLIKRFIYEYCVYVVNFIYLFERYNVLFEDVMFCIEWDNFDFW